MVFRGLHVYLFNLPGSLDKFYDIEVHILRKVDELGLSRTLVVLEIVFEFICSESFLKNNLLFLLLVFKPFH